MLGAGEPQCIFIPSARKATFSDANGESCTFRVEDHCLHCSWFLRRWRARAQTTSEATTGITHLRVTSDVILAKVTRLGVNLGEQNFYDSGQMLKNLLSRNPEFAGMTYRSIFHCETRCGASRAWICRPGIQFPAEFWNGASYEVLEGAAAGQRGNGDAQRGGVPAGIR